MILCDCNQYDPSIPPPGHGANREDMNTIIQQHIAAEKFFQEHPFGDLHLFFCGSLLCAVYCHIMYRRDWYRQNWHFCAIGAVSGFLSGLIVW